MDMLKGQWWKCSEQPLPFSKAGQEIYEVSSVMSSHWTPLAAVTRRRGQQLGFQSCWYVETAFETWSINWADWSYGGQFDKNANPAEGQKLKMHAGLLPLHAWERIGSFLHILYQSWSYPIHLRTFPKRNRTLLDASTFVPSTVTLLHYILIYVTARNPTIEPTKESSYSDDTRWCWRWLHHE